MASPEDIIANLRYEPFDGEDLRRETQEMLEYIEHQRALHGLTEDSYLTVSSFGHFALLNEIGWKRIRYESFRLKTGHMFWMTDEHAAAIGRAVRPSLKHLRIDLTTLAGDGFSVMADNLEAELALEHLCIAHRSGDPVTPMEGHGLGRFATWTRAASLSLWASEFEEGALDALADELGDQENASLKEIDVCDLRKEEPDDKILHPSLEAYLHRNRSV
jgi:hypothetical protein